MGARPHPRTREYRYWMLFVFFKHIGDPGSDHCSLRLHRTTLCSNSCDIDTACKNVLSSVRRSIHDHSRNHCLEHKVMASENDICPEVSALTSNPQPKLCKNHQNQL